MTSCECMEMELSAMVDGEVPPGQAAVLFDHILGCPSCQDFYRQLRRLDTSLAPLARKAPDGDLDDALWAKIERSSGLVTPKPVRVLGMAPWVLRLAAMLVVVTGLWGLGMLRLPAFAVVRDGMEVRAEEDRGRLTDEQFLELAVTVLKADRKYQRKMMEILQTVSGQGSSSMDILRVRRGEAGEVERDRESREHKGVEELQNLVKTSNNNV